MLNLDQTPLAIDRSPKFTPDGVRVLLMNQREHSNWETFLSLVTFPVLAWRQFHMMRDSDNLEDMDYAPDPTVIVPTGRLLHDNLIDEVPKEVIEKRRQEETLREEVTKENKDNWNSIDQKSRKERLREIDQTPKFTRDGQRTILLSQRSMTKYEKFLTVVTMPLFFCWACYKFRKAQNRVIKEGKSKNGGQDWKMMMVYLEDPTLVIPTGPSYFKEGELVNWEEVDQAQFQGESSSETKKVD